MDVQLAPDDLALLRSYCGELHLLVSDDELRQCLVHLELVLEKNQVLNLTRITEKPDALMLHIVDSLTLLPFVFDAPDGALLDMGTGAGFPGVPLAICCDRPVTLLDSVGKKVAAVQEFSDALGLSHVTCVHDRLEEFARSYRQQFSVVVARAVASLPVLLEYARPFLAVGGHAIIAKGVPEDDELVQGEAAARLLGFQLGRVSQFELPDGFGQRHIYDYVVRRPSSVKVPRANGYARKHPLGL